MAPPFVALGGPGGVNPFMFTANWSLPSCTVCEDGPTQLMVMLELLAVSVPLNTPLNVIDVVWCELSSVSVKVSEKAALVNVSGVVSGAALKVRSSVPTMSEELTAWLTGSLVMEIPPVPPVSAGTAIGLRLQL